MAERKPIRIFYRVLSERFDVTNDIASLIEQHDIEFKKLPRPEAT